MLMLFIPMSKQMRDIIPENEIILYLDIGNSSIKAAYKDELRWEQPDSFTIKNTSELVDWINQHHKYFKMVAIASVVEDTTQAIIERLDINKVQVFSIRDIPANLLDYKTPKTLGIDRFFTCYGAVAQANKPVVVIDAGTACTIDYMSEDFVFRGGIIMPGIGILEKAIRDYAPKLPTVLRSIPDEWPGKSTKTSLRWGLYGAFRDSIQTALQKYEEQFGDFDLVITGGAAEWVNTILERESKVRPMLIFEGMQSFLKDYP